MTLQRPTITSYRKLLVSQLLCRLEVSPVSIWNEPKQYLAESFKFMLNDLQQTILTALMLKICYCNSKQCRNNIETLWCAENRRCELFLVTSPLRRFATTIFSASMLIQCSNNPKQFRNNAETLWCAKKSFLGVVFEYNITFKPSSNGMLIYIQERGFTAFAGNMVQLSLKKTKWIGL